MPKPLLNPFFLLISLCIVTRLAISDETMTPDSGNCDTDNPDDCSDPQNPNCRSTEEAQVASDGGVSHDAGVSVDSQSDADPIKEEELPSDSDGKTYSEYCANSSDPNCGKYESQYKGQYAEPDETVRRVCEEWERIDDGVNELCDDPDNPTCKKYRRGKCLKWVEVAESDEYPSFSLLINPADMVFAPLVYKFFPLTLNLNFAGRYAGLDLRPMLFFFPEGKTCGGLIAGIKFLPMGRGLHGFYMLASFGIVSIPRKEFYETKAEAAFMFLAEIGYTWHIKHFVIGIAPGLSLIRGDGVFSVAFGPNLSIGVGR